MLSIPPPQKTDFSNPREGGFAVTDIKSAFFSVLFTVVVTGGNISSF